jgi:hypothetical protein
MKIITVVNKVKKFRVMVDKPRLFSVVDKEFSQKLEINWVQKMVV